MFTKQQGRDPQRSLLRACNILIIKIYRAKQDSVALHNLSSRCPLPLTSSSPTSPISSSKSVNHISLSRGERTEGIIYDCVQGIAKAQSDDCSGCSIWCKLRSHVLKDIVGTLLLSKLESGLEYGILETEDARVCHCEIGTQGWLVARGAKHVDVCVAEKMSRRIKEFCNGRKEG